MRRLFTWLFATEPICGPLCHDVQDEIRAIQQADRIETVARRQQEPRP